MSSSNFYFIALKPSLPEELETRALQTKLLTKHNSEAVVKPIFLPLSFQFNTDEDGIFELGNSLQFALNEVSSFSLDLKKISSNSIFKQLAIQPEKCEQLEALSQIIVEVLLEWNNFSHAPISFDFPKPEVALARSNWPLEAFEQTRINAEILNLNQTWTIETVSMMEWTSIGWNEKFFFPLKDQRLLRNQSHVILQDK